MRINPISNHFMPLNPSAGQEQTEKPTPSYIEQLINKAERLARLSEAGNLSKNRSANLILMAKKAVENGNLSAAQLHVKRAIALMRPEENASLAGPNKEPETAKPETDETPSEKDLQQKEATKHLYKDASVGQAVSFKYGSHLTGPQSFIAVPAHERQHVGHAISKAMLKGEQVQTYVSYKVRYDPKTGDPYLAGGVTRVITHHKPEKT
jgi:hypothetical protein